MEEEGFREKHRGRRVAPNATPYTQCICARGVGKLMCKLCRYLPPPATMARFTVVWASRPCGPAGWLALFVIKAGDVEANPGPTTTLK